MVRIGLTAALLCALALPATASAQTAPVPSPPTLEVYRGQVESFCNETNKARKNAGKGYKQDLEAGKFAQVGRRFISAARVYRRGNARIAAVERPPENAAKLGRWIKSRKADASLYARFGKALKKLTPATVMKTVELQNKVASHSVKTRKIIRGLGFRHCAV
jgi:hypothetical protein